MKDASINNKQDTMRKLSELIGKCEPGKELCDKCQMETTGICVRVKTGFR